MSVFLLCGQGFLSIPHLPGQARDRANWIKIIMEPKGKSSALFTLVTRSGRGIHPGLPGHLGQPHPAQL